MTRVKDDDEFRAVLQRTYSAFNGVGRGGTSYSRSGDQALIELMVLNVRNGDITPATFLQPPMHWPDGNELKALMLSKAEKDQRLRLDVLQWRDVNRNEASRAAITLRNAITAMRMVDQLLDDSDKDDAELHAWKVEIDDYLRITFALDTRDAPQDEAELREWCLSHTAKANPCPEWLETLKSGELPVDKPKRINPHTYFGGDRDD